MGVMNHPAIREHLRKTILAHQGLQEPEKTDAAPDKKLELPSFQGYTGATMAQNQASPLRIGRTGMTPSRLRRMNRKM